MTLIKLTGLYLTHSLFISDTILKFNHINNPKQKTPTNYLIIERCFIYKLSNYHLPKES